LIGELRGAVESDGLAIYRPKAKGEVVGRWLAQGARRSSVMAAAVRHGAAQGCRQQCGRGGGAKVIAALTLTMRGSRGEAGEAGRRAVPRRRARRGEGPGC
jgi:hypothetical protein